jgi:GT2 family glycosyltransferase
MNYSPAITYLIPTHNRHEQLRTTLEAIGRLGFDRPRDLLSDWGGAAVIVVDNASSPPVNIPAQLENGLVVRTIRLNANCGTAARNVGVQHACQGDKCAQRYATDGCERWIIMLDDDSYPLDCGHLEALREAPDDVAGIGADIFVAGGKREAGGLPEVFVGCGAAIRCKAFLPAGGYDPTFDYYAEEYDHCAKLLLNGWRIVHDRRFRVRHEKGSVGRDMNRILHRLVRNNCWVAQRYAPEPQRMTHIQQTITRYADIAVKENAVRGFANGMSDLIDSIGQQPRREMSQDLFDRFTGLAAVRETVQQHRELLQSGPVAIVDEGKNSWVVRQVLTEIGAYLVNDERDAAVLMIGTLSPGPMRDAYERRAAIQSGAEVLLPWN